MFNHKCHVHYSHWQQLRTQGHGQNSKLNSRDLHGREIMLIQHSEGSWPSFPPCTSSLTTTVKTYVTNIAQHLWIRHEQADAGSQSSHSLDIGAHDGSCKKHTDDTTMFAHAIHVLITPWRDRMDEGHWAQPLGLTNREPAATADNIFQVIITASVQHMADWRWFHPRSLVSTPWLDCVEPTPNKAMGNIHP